MTTRAAEGTYSLTFECDGELVSHVVKATGMAAAIDKLLAKFSEARIIAAVDITNERACKS